MQTSRCLLIRPLFNSVVIKFKNKNKMFQLKTSMKMGFALNVSIKSKTMVKRMGYSQEA